MNHHDHDHDHEDSDVDFDSSEQDILASLASIPPPPALRWQLTVSDAFSGSINVPVHEDTLRGLYQLDSSLSVRNLIGNNRDASNPTLSAFTHSNHTNHDHQHTHKQATSTPLDDNEQFQDEQVEFRVLTQFHSYTYNARNVGKLVDGFTHCTYTACLRCECTSYIYKDIISVIYRFLFEVENTYLRLGYRVYQSMQHTHPQRTFCGQQLMKVVATCMLQPHDHEQDTHTVCEKLLRFKFIQLVAIRTTFASLFDDESGSTTSIAAKSTFNGADDRYVYQFVDNRIEQFSHCVSSQRS